MYHWRVLSRQASLWRRVRLLPGNGTFTTAAHRQQMRARTAAFVSMAVLGGIGSIAFVKCTAPIKAEEQRGDHSHRSTLPLSQAPQLEHDISDPNINAAKAEFIDLLGYDGVNIVPGDLNARSSTEWSPSPTQQLAAMIVFPCTTSHVSEIMKICHKRRIPVTPFSGGTSLDGALATTRGGVVVDVSRMNKIKALHRDDMDVVVEPAVGWQELNQILAKDDLFFPVDPGPGAQIGGMINTGCSGTNAFRYGPMKDWVIGCTVVLADGTITKTRLRPRKSSAGYDLTRLIVGSSGTLGIVTEATLKLTSLPQNVHVAVVAFDSIQAAVTAAGGMIRKGLRLDALELMDEFSMRAANESGYTNTRYDEKPTLFLKFAGPSKEEVTREVATVRELLQSEGCEGFKSSDDPETIADLWSARKTILWNIIALKGEGDTLLSCDTAVPITRMAEAIEFARQKAVGTNITMSLLGHIGDGNFHTTILHSPKDKEFAEQIILDVRRKGIELEGTITGEHGIGVALRDLLVEELGENATDMMRKIKFALDPLCLLGCDKVIRVGDEPQE